MERYRGPISAIRGTDVKERTFLEGKRPTNTPYWLSAKPYWCREAFDGGGRRGGSRIETSQQFIFRRKTHRNPSPGILAFLHREIEDDGFKDPPEESLFILSEAVGN